MLVTRPVVQAPTPVPLSGTLLDIVSPTDRAGEWFDPKGLYQTLNCAVSDTATAICPDPRGPKDFEQNYPSTVDGILAAVYTPFKCKLVGSDFDVFEQQMSGLIDRKEYLAIERLLVEQRFTGEQGGDKARVISGTPAPSPQTGLAYLEQDMAENYSGEGIIFMSRVLASLMTQNGAIELDGKILRTKLGTPIAAGGGAHPGVDPDSGAAPALGDFWMYGTGLISINRSGQRVMRETDRVNNDGVILFERLYEIAVDCYVSAMKVST